MFNCVLIISTRRTLILGDLEYYQPTQEGDILDRDENEVAYAHTFIHHAVH